MNEINILSSDFRRKLEINENNEKLVDLRDECPEIAYEIAGYLNRFTEIEDAYFVRESIAKMINYAQSSLPKDLKLLVRCGYRTPEVQARQYDIDYENLKIENPTWGKERLDIEIVKRTDPPDIGPHCTGGAVDISIINKDGNKLYMGTEMGVFNEDTYTHSKSINSEAKSNREILTEAMTSVGFYNFPAEWWHWSYGDREWAYANNRVAFYGTIPQRLDLEDDYYAQDEIFSNTSNAF